MKINVSNPQLDVWNANLNENENKNKTLRYENETLTLTLIKAIIIITLMTDSGLTTELRVGIRQAIG